ncbi:hypothetical protein [Neobacillus sedimentimangrovi]|uniref:hypothetical protein n=1 Tax=Neobacillus sedimentimangrovi TaxID=2699460 RepID=UPI001F353E98|nr:hypothetical protein [Neobacillus sedimentimangrovi]
MAVSKRMENVKIEMELKKYNRIKSDLLKMAKCIDSCSETSEKEFYQNVCLEYSKELKQIKKFIEDSYDIEICPCCDFNKEGV